MGVSFYYTPECAVYIYLFVCDIKSEYSKNTLCVRPQQTYALLHKTYIKVLLVLRYQDSTCVDAFKCGMITYSAKETGK